jgi:hypothetical protein
MSPALRGGGSRYLSVLEPKEENQFAFEGGVSVFQTDAIPGDQLKTRLFVKLAEWSKYLQ